MSARPLVAQTTLTALVADDEPLARQELAYLLGEFPEIEVVASAANGLEAVAMIEEHEPDVVFLDVQMPGLDGMGVIQKVREKNLPLPQFVLATAFDHYAVQAFELEAADYLLKPFDRARLQQAVAKLVRSTQERPRLEPNTATGQPGLQRSKLLVKSHNRNFIVDAQDVIYATIDDGLITVVATDVEGQSNYRTIEELQSNLDPDLFWRVHRSYLVNINRIREVVPWFKSSYQLRMDDKKQTEIPVSRVQTKRLRSLLRM